MQIHVGIITHRHGNNAYAARTTERLDEQLANYCRDWWESDGPDDGMPSDDRELIDRYFQYHADMLDGDESYETHTCELEDDLISADQK